MSLQFLIGGSGSGKSRELYKNIYQASVQSPGTQFLVIVPEQFTMQTQKEIVALHPKKGILNIDVLSFQRLSHRIFAEVGADRRTVLEEMGKTLLLRRTATKHKKELKLLGSNLKKKGYLSEVKSLISELTQYDIDDTKMEAMLEYAKAKPRLYYKLQDIQTLYQGFQEELGTKYITAEETLEALCQVADQSAILKNCVIALDGFTGFTPIQYKLLRKLMTLAKEIYVTITIDPQEDYYRIYGEYELFYLSKRTIKSLTQLAKEEGCELLPPVVLRPEVSPRFAKAEELAFLEKRLFRYSRQIKGEKQYGGEDNGEVNIRIAGSTNEEIHYVARTIRKLVQEGYRYQDIAIIVGNVEAYTANLPAIMKQYQIPVFMDNTRSLSSNPFVEFLRGVMELMEQDYTREHMFRFLRTGLCNIPKEQLDRLENYVLAAGIHTRKEWEAPFKRLLKGMTEENLKEMNRLRRTIIKPIRMLHKAMKANSDAREKTTALYYFICSYKIQQQLEAYQAYFEQQERPDLQKEYSQVYSLVMALFDKVVELLGEEVLTLTEYREILETGLEEMKVGIIPPSADLVPVGNLERTRLKDIRILFFMGLNDGYVPAVKSGGGLLSDNERETLAGSKVELAPMARQETYIQKFYLYLNLTKPSHRLYLSCATSDSAGKTMRPSYVLSVVGKLFPNIAKEEQEEQLTDLAVSPEAAMQYLLKGLQTLREKEPDPQWVELLNWYRRQEEYQKEVEQLLQAVFQVFTEDRIGREAAHLLYGEVLENSVSRLESYARCAFSHFLEYGLQLKEREEFAFKVTDLGNIVHKAVELFVQRITEEKISWKEMTEAERNRLMDACVDQITEEAGLAVLHSTKRNEYMITRIRRIMRRTAWALQQQIQAGEFYPEGTEISFAQIRDLEAVNIALSPEEKMHLKGRIDRIDLCEQGDQVYVKVIDYKSGNTSFDLVALYYGLQLQLVVYLNAATQLEREKHPDKEVIPAGVFYYRVKDPLLETDEVKSPEEINEELLKELKLNGLVNEDPDIYRKIDATFEKASMIIPVTEKGDGTLSKASRTASSAQFHMLTGFVQDKMREIGREIIQGNVAAVPYERGGKTGCEYCSFKEICRMDRKIPGTHTRRLRELSAEEVWKQMEMLERGDEVDEGTDGCHRIS